MAQEGQPNTDSALHTRPSPATQSSRWSLAMSLLMHAVLLSLLAIVWWSIPVEQPETARRGSIVLTEVADDSQ